MVRVPRVSRVRLTKGFGWNTVRDSLERNAGAWNVAQIAATIGLLVSQAYLYLRLD